MKIVKLIIATVLMCCGLYGCLLVVDNASAARTQYEQEHNCKYDYNDLCYTEAERPWLFK